MNVVCCVCGKEINQDAATPVVDKVGRSLFVCEECEEE